MRTECGAPARRRAWAACGIVLAAGFAGGCQSYERAPLDLAAHARSFAARGGETEAVSAFATRLGEVGRAPRGFDLADGLSPAEGEVLTLFFNPELRLARQEAGVALAELETAGLWEDPVFGFDGADILSPAGVLEYGLTLGLTLPISGRLAVERARAGAAYEAELRRVVDAEWTTRALVRRAWGVWAAEEERVRLLREIVRQSGRTGSIIARLEEVGELSRVEARLFRLDLAERRAALAASEADAERARLDLLGVMGLPPTAEVELLAVFPSVEPEGGVGEGDPVGRLVEANTALAVRRAEYQAAEEALRAEIRRQYPDVELGFGYGSEDRDDRLLLGLSVRVPLWNANRAGIAEARAQREAARVRAETALEGLIRELAAAQAALRAAGAQRERYESEVLPMLDEQLAEVDRLAELGEVDAFLMLETAARLYEAKSRLLDLRLAETEARIELARLLGPEAELDPAPAEEHEGTETHGGAGEGGAR